MNEIAMAITEKDWEMKRLTVNSPFTYTMDTDVQDLVFPLLQNYDDPIKDRHPWNASRGRHARDGSLVGGNAIAMQDDQKGRDLAQGYLEMGTYYTLSKILDYDTSGDSGKGKPHTGTNVSIDINKLRNADNSFDEAVEGLFIDQADRFRGFIRDENATVIARVPYFMKSVVTRYLLKRDTPLGDSAVVGRRRSGLFELDMRFSKSMPYTFTLPDTLIAKMVAGKVVNLLQGSNYAAPKMVAAGTDTKGQPNQVNVGSAAANTRANLINFLTNQTHPEGVTNKHGYRVQYDVDDPENWKNLQRANMYFTSSHDGTDSAAATTTITVYGAMMPPKLEVRNADGSVSSTDSVSNLESKILFTVEGGGAVFILRDALEYNEWFADKNSSVIREHAFGTFGAGLRIDAGARMMSAGLTIANSPLD